MKWKPWKKKPNLNLIFFYFTDDSDNNVFDNIIASIFPMVWLESLITEIRSEYQNRMESNESLSSSSEKLIDRKFLTLTMETPSKYDDLEILNFNSENSLNVTEGPFCQNEFMNMSYMNVSCDSVIEYSVPLYGYMMPFLLIITVTANTLIILVLSKRTMSTPTNFVLKCEFFFKILLKIFVNIR